MREGEDRGKVEKKREVKGERRKEREEILASYSLLPA